ncbi:serine/threonine-protein kinase [Bifidobacterium eulemuris]|uniref:non-specific serine/threonine protein kinase n=1 Tax=Bifidobacterium eulemuris TaxID=1765219 RepID=A0A261G1W2_9BIFI|nr:serine/threonine-protein kinase [Bifidobacterium eulemuris]OZG65225.1 protein kinase [Bifidobacterium eulemuris]QOL32351.1 protein kinase [Bifidobacterium eulemuris]
MSDLSALNLEPGDMVGGYTLVSRLGAGAMGSVWRVVDGGGQSYAMKILRDSLADDDARSAAVQDPNLKEHVTARERLRREAMALRKVSHPGVCGIVDMELDDSLAFIVTELIDGRNLRDDVAVNGRYTGDDLERLARKLIEAVKAVHAAGLVHRDIKPTNVMVSASGPVLVDFGIAMGAGESHVTRTGLVMGTPGFIAPEIIDGAESDEQTDWWSVASVLAFAATGAPVFGTKPMMAVLERAASGNPNLTGLPANTMAAFRSALAPDRTQRCSPDQLLHAIAVDALRPLDGGDRTGESAEVVHPFEHSAAGAAASALVSDVNPRMLWRDEDDADIIRTEAMGETAATHATHTGDAGDADTVTLEETAATTAMDPRARRLEGTAVMPRATTPLEQAGATAVLPAAQPPASIPVQGQQSWNPADPAPTAVDPTIRPALQRVIDQAAQSVPTEAIALAPAVNPADVRRGRLLKRGVLPLFVLALPLAVLAMPLPQAALIAAAALLWLLLTAGYNTASQLERESKRGGARKGTDTMLRVAALPWHLLKGLLAAIPRALAMALIVVALTAAGVWALDLPYAMVDLSVGGWVIPLPTLTDTALSYTGLTLACATTVGWLLTVFGPRSMMVRLGAGALRGGRRADKTTTGTAATQAAPPESSL